MPKTATEAAIQERVNAFTEELTQLIREAAMASVQEALSGVAAPGGKKSAGRPPARKATAKKARRKGAGGKRIRRSPEELEAMQKSLLAYVGSNPGQRLEQISTGMGIDSGELKQPIAMLLESKQLKKAGQRRGTKYTSK